jgi:hypothetical protein
MGKCELKPDRITVDLPRHFIKYLNFEIENFSSVRLTMDFVNQMVPNFWQN